MTVLYFAHARRATGLSEEQIALNTPVGTHELWTILVARHPDLAPLRPVSRLARGNDFLPADATLAPHDEIAIIPPVSGG
jgi:molybdopterin converting factor subunit 1